MQISDPFLVVPRPIMVVVGHVENPKVKVTNLLKIFKDIVKMTINQKSSSNLTFWSRRQFSKEWEPSGNFQFSFFSVIAEGSNCRQSLSAQLIACVSQLLTTALPQQNSSQITLLLALFHKNSGKSNYFVPGSLFVQLELLLSQPSGCLDWSWEKTITIVNQRWRITVSNNEKYLNSDFFRQIQSLKWFVCGFKIELTPSDHPWAK